MEVAGNRQSQDVTAKTRGQAVSTVPSRLGSPGLSAVDEGAWSA